MAKPIRRKVQLKSLIRDRQYQIREDGLNGDHVEDIREAIRAKKNVEAVKVMLVENVGPILTDGFHRAKAYELEGRNEIWAYCWSGDEKDALVAAATGNKKSADAPLKLTREDKRRAVNLYLDVYPQASSVEVSKAVGVSDEFVRLIKKKRRAEKEQPEEKEPAPNVGSDKHQQRSAPSMVEKRPQVHIPVDWDSVEYAIGILVRAVDAARREYPKQVSEVGKRAAHRLLDEFEKLTLAPTGWRGVITGNAGKKGNDERQN